MVWPVTYPDRSEARNTAAPATSSTCPSRPSGTVSAVRACRAAGSSSPLAAASRAMPSVQVMSGARALTRIPCGASSNAAVFVKLRTPALAAA